jgi:hypothetical protein
MNQPKFSINLGSEMRVKHSFDRKLTHNRMGAVINILASAKNETDIQLAYDYAKAELVAGEFIPTSTTPTLLPSNTYSLTFVSHKPEIVAAFVAQNLPVLPPFANDRSTPTA